jgi:hypothetical protein
LRLVLLFACVALPAIAVHDDPECRRALRRSQLEMRIELVDATDGHNVAKILERHGVVLLNPINLGSSRFLSVFTTIKKATQLLGITTDIRTIWLRSGAQISPPPDIPPSREQFEDEDRLLDNEREDRIRLARIAHGLDPDDEAAENGEGAEDSTKPVSDPPVQMLIRLDESRAGGEVAKVLESHGVEILNPFAINKGLNLIVRMDERMKSKLLRMPLGIEKIVPDSSQ